MKTKEEIRIEKEQLRALFKNCIKLQFNEKVNIKISREIIINGLIKANVDTKNIKTITQYRNNRTWMIGFNDNICAKNYFDKSVEIAGNQILIKPPVDDFKYHCFKIMWMPIYFSVGLVANFLEGKDGETVKIQEIFCKEEHMQHISTGVFNITIKLPDHTAINTDDLTGIKTIANQKLLITRYGDPVKCIFCLNKGHKRSECEKYNSICQECGKRGHTKCSFASKLTPQVDEYDEDDIETDENGQLNEQEQVTISSIIGTLNLEKQQIDSNSQNQNPHQYNNNNNTKKSAATIIKPPNITQSTANLNHNKTTTKPLKPTEKRGSHKLSPEQEQKQQNKHQKSDNIQ
jgi:hypothetical protein